MKLNLKFIVGVILLATNQPLGWGAMLLSGAIALKTGKTFFYFIGIGAYALSWVMLGVGLFLAGKEGLPYLKMLLKRTGKFLAGLFS